VPQVLEPDQHGQHSFELAVEMALVAAEPFELVGIERLAERLLAASVQPHRGRCLAVVQFIRITHQHIGRPSPAGMPVQIA